MEATEKKNLTFDETSRILVGSQPLHYHIAGSGPTLLLLHGSGPGVSGWSNFGNNLPNFAERFRVIILDQPGYGRSYIPEFDRPYGRIVSDAILRIFKEEGVDTAHVVGNSMGAGSAMTFTFVNPTRVNRVVLMGGGGGFSPNIFSVAPAEGIKRLMEFNADPTRERLVEWLKTMVFDQNRITDELIDERFANSSREGVIEWSKTVYNARNIPGATEAIPLYSQLSKIHHQILITWGLDDRVVPFDHAFFALRQLPNAELHAFSNCGHWAMIERKVEFERVVTEFLTRAIPNAQ